MKTQTFAASAVTAAALLALTVPPLPLGPALAVPALPLGPALAVTAVIVAAGWTVAWGIQAPATGMVTSRSGAQEDVRRSRVLDDVRGKSAKFQTPFNCRKHVLESVRGFIELNRDVLLDYWEMRIDTDELRQRLKPTLP